jgi:hypothetical protein
VSSQDGQAVTVKRLSAIAGMLGSDHDGERANAARLATIELRRLGLTWAELIARAFTRPKPEPRKPEPPPRNPYGPYGYQNGFQEGWEPRQRPDWMQEAQRRRQEQEASQRPNPGQRWHERDGYRVWDIICAAELRWHSDDLIQWDKNFLTTFKNYGPTARATAAQWDQLIRIAKKLGLKPSKV